MEGHGVIGRGRFRLVDTKVGAKIRVDHLGVLDYFLHGSCYVDGGAAGRGWDLPGYLGDGVAVERV